MPRQKKQRELTVSGFFLAGPRKSGGDLTRVPWSVPENHPGPSNQQKKRPPKKLKWRMEGSLRSECDDWTMVNSIKFSIMLLVFTRTSWGSSSNPQEKTLMPSDELLFEITLLFLRWGPLSGDCHTGPSRAGTKRRALWSFRNPSESSWWKDLISNVPIGFFNTEASEQKRKKAEAWLTCLQLWSWFERA